MKPRIFVSTIALLLLGIGGYIAWDSTKQKPTTLSHSPKPLDKSRELSPDEPKNSQRQDDLPAVAKAYSSIPQSSEAVSANDSEKNKSQRYIFLNRIILGNMANMRGDLPDAAKHYSAAMEIAQALADSDPNNTEWQRHLSNNHQRFGEIAIAQRDLPSAAKSYTAAMEIAQSLAARDPQNTECQRDLSTSHTMLAGVAKMQRDAERARLHYRKSYDILRAMVDAGNQVTPQDKTVLQILKKKADIE
jgi:tetratricopeptide (TPR) repeat protein